MRRWRMLVGLLLAAGLVAGCGGGEEAQTPVTVTVTTPEVASADAELLDEMAATMAELSRIASEECGSEAACIRGVTEDVGNLAESRRAGVEARIAASTSPCVTDIGNRYVLALDYYVLARDFLREGFIEQATDSTVSGNENVVKAGEAADNCPATLAGGLLD